MKSMKTKKRILITIAHLFLAVLAVIWVFPIFWVIMTSFRAGKGSYSTEFIPDELTLGNYVKLFTDTGVFDFPRMFMNTFIIAAATCILATFFLISIAYTMSRMRFKMRKPYLNIALILGMFPGFMSMIAVYYILKGMGLTDGGLKLIALILVYSGGANLLSFYVAKGFFDTIPKGIDEAAYIDGATKWQQIVHITLPFLKPMAVVLTIMRVGSMFSSNFDLFYQVPMNSGQLYSVTNTIDVFVYNTLKESNNVGLSSAVSFVQSVAGLVLVLVTNQIIRWIDRDLAMF